MKCYNRTKILELFRYTCITVHYEYSLWIFYNCIKMHKFFFWKHTWRSYWKTIKCRSEQSTLSLQMVEPKKETEHLKCHHLYLQVNVTFLWVRLVAFSASEGLQFTHCGIWKLLHHRVCERKNNYLVVLSGVSEYVL